MTKYRIIYTDKTRRRGENYYGKDFKSRKDAIMHMDKDKTLKNKFVKQHHRKVRAKMKIISVATRTSSPFRINIKYPRF